MKNLIILLDISLLGKNALERCAFIPITLMFETDSFLDPFFNLYFHLLNVLLVYKYALDVLKLGSNQVKPNYLLMKCLLHYFN